ncbi:MAG: glycoside hydrolase family 5 protein [Candidatus Dormibacteria bacterium]
MSHNHLVDTTGAPLRLIGVDRSGTEYACIQGWGIFDGPSDATSVANMAAWHINAVRLPLNEDCWLGINGVPAAYGGTNYRQAVQQYVTLLHQAGIAVILDLHLTAPGAVAATGQVPMADADHTPAFWSSVASAYAADPSVVFDLFNEPFISTGNAQTSDPWACWLAGCTINAGNGVPTSWQSAGMQQLVNAVRATGAAQPIMLGGLQWSNDLTQWLTHEPNDSAQQLAASFHDYNFNTCNNQTCWNSQVGPVAQHVPVITGEIGEDDCAGGFITQYMQWADSTGISYVGWTWDTWNCSSGPALITAYDGTPTAYGAAFRSHLAALAQSRLVIIGGDPLTAFNGPAQSATATARPPTSQPATGAASVVPVGELQPLGGDAVEEGVLPAEQGIVQGSGALRPPQVTGWRDRYPLT